MTHSRRGFLAALASVAAGARALLAGDRHAGGDAAVPPVSGGRPDSQSSSGAQWAEDVVQLAAERGIRVTQLLPRERQGACEFTHGRATAGFTIAGPPVAVANQMDYQTARLRNHIDEAWPSAHYEDTVIHEWDAMPWRE